MPSLRRTLSSPAVHTISNKPFLSNPTYPNAATRTQGHGHRRSSGSDIANRRVLADIEWWQVVDGQCHLDTNRRQDRNRALERDEHSQQLVEDVLLNGAELLNFDIGIKAEFDALPEPLAWDTTSTEPSPIPTPNNASVELPRTPLRRYQTESALHFAIGSEEPAPERGLSFEDAQFDLPDLDFDAHFMLPSLPSANDKSKDMDPFLFDGGFETPDFLSFDDGFNHTRDLTSPFVSYSTSFFG